MGIKSNCMIELDDNATTKMWPVEKLEQYDVVCTKSDPVFGQLAATAAIMLNKPLAMINFIDRRDVWEGQIQTERLQQYTIGVNLCALAIHKEAKHQFSGVMDDFSLISSPMLAGEYGIKFYATASITTDQGFNVGYLYVADKEVVVFGEDEKRKLDWVADQVRLEMRKRNKV